MRDYTQQITREYHLEQPAGKGPLGAGDIPGTYESITPEWLTGILCRGIPGARVTGRKLDITDYGTTSRRRIFIHYNTAGEQAGLPSSIFCKGAQELQARINNANSGFIQGEDRFYRHFRPLLAIEAPICYFTAYNEASFKSIIVFDDLKRHGAEFCSHDTQISWQRAAGQLQLLAVLHGRFFQSKQPEYLAFPNFEQLFRHIDRSWNLQRLAEEGFVASEAVIPPRLFSRGAEVWPATLKSAELHIDRPRTLTHSDVHLRNWYLLPDDRMGLSDWQCCARGDWARDVAYVLSTALAVERRRDWEQDLLRYYLECLREVGGPAAEFDEAWYFYRLHMLTVLSFWTATITAETHPADATMELIKRTATAVDDLDVLDEFLS
jgi:thiamine kinase-like enzyme